MGGYEEVSHTFHSIQSFFVSRFATLKLNTIVNKEATADKVSLIVPVHSIMYPHEQIANLNLSIEGILFLQGLL